MSGWSQQLYPCTRRDWPLTELLKYRLTQRVLVRNFVSNASKAAGPVGGYSTMRGKANPTTHISSLARLHVDYCIQMVRPWQLLAALDESSDLRHDLGDTMQDHFMELLARKYENCTEWYFTNLATLGVQEPIVVIIRSDGVWQMDEGHHRLAWSLWNNIESIPVIFDDSGADDDSHMGYLVSRANVEAYHHTADDQLIVDPCRALEPSTIDEPETVFNTTTHRAGKKRGGRHRAPEQGFLSRV